MARQQPEAETDRTAEAGQGLEWTELGRQSFGKLATGIFTCRNADGKLP
jgi:hypothetical protein